MNAGAFHPLPEKLKIHCDILQTLDGKKLVGCLPAKRTSTPHLRGRTRRIKHASFRSEPRVWTGRTRRGSRAAPLAVTATCTAGRWSDSIVWSGGILEWSCSPSWVVRRPSLNSSRSCSTKSDEIPELYRWSTPRVGIPVYRRVLDFRMQG